MRRAIQPPVSLLVAAWLIGALVPAVRAQVTFSWTEISSPDGGFNATFGDTLCAADANNDGFDDLFVFDGFVTLGGQLQAGKGWLFYGPTFTSYLEIESQDPGLLENLGDVGSGTSGCSAGDVDGDGNVDILVGAPNYRAGFVPPVGRAHLFFGPDYETEVLIYDPTPGDFGRFGESVLLVDLTRDGRADLLVGAPDATQFLQAEAAGEVYFWDALDLMTPVLIMAPQPMAGASFGSSLDVGDADTDGQLELLIGAEKQPFGGALHVFDASTFAYEQTVLPTGGVGGDYGDVIYTGDLDGDQINDLIVTSWSDAMTGCSDAGAVAIVPGPLFDRMSMFLAAPEPCEGLGFGRNALAEDINKDGLIDVIVGAHAETPSRVYVFLGPDFTEIIELGDTFPGTVLGLGWELAAGDFDGDGFLELAIDARSLVFPHDLRTLVAETSILSIAAGGDVNFSLDASSDQAGNLYLAAVGMSGSMPGLILGPGVYLPLNVDSLTVLGLSLLNTSVLPGAVGVLDVDGKATFQLHIDPGMFSPLIGQTMTFAVITAESGGRLGIGSSAATVEFVP